MQEMKQRDKPRIRISYDAQMRYHITPVFDTGIQLF